MERDKRIQPIWQAVAMYRSGLRQPKDVWSITIGCLPRGSEYKTLSELREDVQSALQKAFSSNCLADCNETVRLEVERWLRGRPEVRA